MKAKDYFKSYVNENQEKESCVRVVDIFMKMFHESKDIQIMRKAKSDESIIAIMNEQNQKANSFIRKVNEHDGLGFKRDAFKIFMNQISPEFSKMIGW